MKYGFLKVAAASPDLKVADVKFNAKKIEEEISVMEKTGVEVLVFPELSICGYTCGDLLLQPFLIEGCLDMLKEICEYTKGIKMLVFVGLPFVYDTKLYNVAAAISNGKLLGLIPKSTIPNYSEFYERRYFTPALDKNLEVKIDGNIVPFGTRLIFKDTVNKTAKIACEICEDLWMGNSPSIWHAAAGATVIVNLSASDETIGKAEYRRTLLKAQSGKNVCAYIYADAGKGESTTDMVFAGHDLILENGSILKESELFSNESICAEVDTDFLASERVKLNSFTSYNNEGYEVIETNFTSENDITIRKVSKTPFVPEEAIELGNRAELILRMQSEALAKRIKHTNAKTAVIGISGGLDSSLALMVTARAFDIIKKDRKDILAITMPGFGTTGKTYSNSLKLIETIGASGSSVSIQDSVLQHFKDIGQDKDKFDVTYENAQARMRTLILMDTANKTGGLVIGTGDLSELALGWCTYNGDHMSMYGVNASVPKTLVKHLVRREAERLGGEIQKVLLDILETEISPELLPPDKKGNIAQKTEDLIGPYELHDFYLYHAIRLLESPKKVFYLARYAFNGKYSNEVLLKWLKNFYRRFFSQQFKRSCIPDGVKIGSVTLSPRGDHRMPSDASGELWLKELDEICL